jgi:acyl carrier protein
MANIDKEKIMQLVINAVKEIGEEEHNKTLVGADKDTLLYGLKSNLDSLMLVRLITEVEERISEASGIDIAIADERAMSQKHSPFLSVQSLADYIEKLITE